MFKGSLAGLQRPVVLRPGDRVATVSLSSGLAGDPGLRWRYERAKKRLTEDFGLDVVEMPHTLSGSDYLYCHPQERAQDLMMAFADPDIRAVFSCIGGNDSIRLLPYIDYSVIAKNPKHFLGYSDSTITHLICLKAGVASIYGPSLLAEFAENVRMFSYTEKWVRKLLFDSLPPGIVPPPTEWTNELIPWEEKFKDTPKSMQPHEGYMLLQGEGCARGRLIGGCLDVLEQCRGTEIWPAPSLFDGAILFIETAEGCAEPRRVESWLRGFAALGVFSRLHGLIWGKPSGNVYFDEYREIILKVVRDEAKRGDLPILYNMGFGHNEPLCCLPYGALAQIDCDAVNFALLEAAAVIS